MEARQMNVISWQERPNGDHVDRYGNVLSTKLSRAQQDIPLWKRFEDGRLEDVNGLTIPGRRAQPRDWEEYGQNADELGIYRCRQPSNRAEVPDPQASFLRYACEEQHGHDHQLKWCRLLLATGYDWQAYWQEWMAPMFKKAEIAGQMDYDECLVFYFRHNRNGRWTLAKKWFEENTDGHDDTLEEKAAIQAEEELANGMDRYYNGPPTQGNYSAEQWRQRYGKDPEVALVVGWGKYIIDPSVGYPLWGLDGDFPAHHCWKYDQETDLWIDMDAGNDTPPIPPMDWMDYVEDNMAVAIADRDWKEVARLATLKANEGDNR